MFLQHIRQEFIHPRNLRRHTKIDRPVSYFDDEAAQDIRIDLLKHPIVSQYNDAKR